MRRDLFIVVTCILLVSCTTSHNKSGNPSIQLDLTSLDENGLRGPPSGKVALAYEFCIPDTDEHRIQVRAIDPTVDFMRNSPGRIGCTEGQCLCIGSTHQPGFQDVVRRLAELSFIHDIRRCDFE